VKDVDPMAAQAFRKSDPARRLRGPRQADGDDFHVGWQIAAEPGGQLGRAGKVKPEAFAIEAAQEAEDMLFDASANGFIGEVQDREAPGFHATLPSMTL
jgi:hypothetical protein